MAERDINQEIVALNATLASIESVLDLPKLKSQLADLEVKAGAPDLWNDPESAQKVTSALSRVQGTINKVSSLRSRVGDLPAHVVEAVGRSEGQDQRVVLVLVPALEEDAIRLTGRLVHADDLGVVRGRDLEVGHADLDVGQAQDAHVCTDMNRWFNSPS